MPQSRYKSRRVFPAQVQKTQRPTLEAQGRAHLRWKTESAEAREALGISRAFQGWTDRDGFAGEGLALTDRVVDLLNVTAARLLGQGGPEYLMAAVVDVSQSVSRCTYTKPDLRHPCLTTSSEWYSFREDRIVLPQELMCMHGFVGTVHIPADLLLRDLKHMVGGG